MLSPDPTPSDTVTVVYRYLFWHIQRGDRECADIDDLCHPAEVQ
jgi:hypothetical protein